MMKNKESKAEPKAKPAAADVIINAMPDAVIVLDIDGKITALNPTYTRMFGWEPEDRIGKSFTEFKSLKAEQIEKFMKLLGNLIETGHAEPLETVIGTKDGREIPTSVGYSLIMDAEGNPKNIIAVLRDITELKRAEEERVKAVSAAVADKARAEEAEKARKSAEERAKELEDAGSAMIYMLKDIDRTSKELEKRIRDLETFQRITMDREKRIIELKKEIKELKKQLEVKGG